MHPLNKYLPKNVPLGTTIRFGLIAIGLMIMGGYQELTFLRPILAIGGFVLLFITATSTEKVSNQPNQTEGAS
jgi:type IV secretory pathway VirB2 component (pilin)